MRSIVALALLVLIFGSPLAAQQAPVTVPGKPGPATPDTQAPEATRKQPEPRAGRESATSGIPGRENQLFLEVKVQTNHTEITPDTRGPDGRPLRSFLTPGNNTFADFTYFQDHAFGGTNRIQVLSILRSNNDPRVDPERNSFQRGYVRINTPNWEWNFGDYLVNYSRFTYNQNIKGLHMIRKFDGGFSVMANAGVFTDRWGSVFKDDLIGKPFTRVVAGVRAEERITSDKRIGFNFSHGRDLPDSLRRDLLLGFGFIPVENQIVSVDTRMTFANRFSVDGEMAYSWTNPDKRVFRDKVKDWGARLDTSFREGPFFLRTSYTRLMPNFLSINARQLADLQDVLVRGGLDLGSHVTAEGSFRRTNNNLDDNRPDGSTIFRAPEVRFSFRQIPGLGRSIFDVGYRERQQDGPFRATLKAREDRVTRIPFVEATIPIGSTLFTAGYEHRDNEDRHQPGQDTDTNRYSVGLRSIFDLGGWQFSPLLRYEIEREEFLRLAGFNNNRTVQAALFLEAPKYFLFEVMYRQIGATLFSECLTTPSELCSQLVRLPPNTLVLLPSGFGRPAFRAAVTFKMWNNEDRYLTLSFDRNNNFFALPARNFRERIVALTFVWRFRR